MHAGLIAKPDFASLSPACLALSCHIHPLLSYPPCVHTHTPRAPRRPPGQNVIVTT